MKAEREQVEVEFVPVTVTLESQEEVDSLFAIGNNCHIGHALPALNCWFRQLEPFISNHSDTDELWNKLQSILR